MLHHHLPERLGPAGHGSCQCTRVWCRESKHATACQRGHPPIWLLGVALGPPNLKLATEELDAVQLEAIRGLLGAAELDESELAAAAAHRCAGDRVARDRVHLHSERHLIQEL